MTTLWNLLTEHPVSSVLILLLFASFLGPFLSGARFIGEREVGLVVKRFARRALPPGRLVALEGEAGYQAQTLSPGVHFGYWTWQYSVRTVPVTVIPQGEIGLVVAADGAPMALERILGRMVDCDAFQDADRFLRRGGEKGRQLGILTAGTYRINTVLFTVITAQDAPAHAMRPEALQVYRIETDRVGIVTTLDGTPIEAGEIAGRVVGGHESFQNGQAFLDAHGQRGLQEQVLLAGSWNLNPWFVQVEPCP